MVGDRSLDSLGLWKRPCSEKILDADAPTAAVMEVLRRQPKQVLLSALLRMAEQAPGFVFGAFIFTYGTTVLGNRAIFYLGRDRADSSGFCGSRDAGICRNGRPEEHVHVRLRVMGILVSFTSRCSTR